MRIAIIDFETVDPFLSSKINPITKEKPWNLGPGWAYEINHPTGRFKPTGCAVMFTNCDPEYVTNWGDLKELLYASDALVCHNALYDIGILKLLGFDYSERLIYDTKLMAALYDNTEPSYGLDALGEKYLQQKKDHTALIEAAKTHHEFKNDKDALTWAYMSMDKLQESHFDLMAQYAIQDINITKMLFDKYLNSPSLAKIDWLIYSDLVKCLVDSRSKGVRIDLKRCREIDSLLKPKIASFARDIFALAGKEINLNSTQQITQICTERKLKVPKTAKGNASATKGWMAMQRDPFVKALSEYRRYNKAHKDFIHKFMVMQEKILNKTSSEVKELDYGVLHPELTIFGAKTGRFSSKNPNIQNIPSGDRDKELGTMCRSIFVPWEGDKWYAPDLSNQEGRLQLHYASLIKAPGAEKLVNEFIKDPNYDMHTAIAASIHRKNLEEVTKDERTAAKTINLGMSYGMGVKKLANSLKISEEEAREFKKTYNKHCPYLQALFDYCKKVLEIKGHITTIGGRHNRLAKEENDQVYKALNMLIQGSALDQIVNIMVWCHRNKLPILFTVHDEVAFSCKDEQKVLELKKYMEHGMSLKVPMVVEMDSGNSWSEAKYGK